MNPDRRALEKTRRILVVDSYTDCADSVAALLGVFGHEVRCAYDAADALAQALSFRPDVIFLEMQMRDSDGYRIAFAFRQLSVLLDTQIIALTVFSDSLSRARSALVGCNLHLVKPASVTTLLEAIRSR